MEDELDILEQESDAIPLPIKDDEPLKDKKVDITIDLQRDHTSSEVVEDNQPVLAPEHIQEQLRYIQERAELVSKSASLLIGANIELDAGNENFIFSPIKRLLLEVVNIVAKLVNTFKTYLLNGFKDFKRSELSEFYDSNSASMLTLRTIYSGKQFYQDLETVIIDLPRGMNKPYPQSLAELLKYLNFLDMLNRSKQCLDAIKHICDEVSQGSSQLSSYVKTVNQNVYPQSLIKDFDRLTDTYFTSKSKDKDSFGNQFASMDEFFQTLDSCRDADSYLHTVSAISDCLEDINTLLNKNIDSYSEKFTAIQVKDIAQLIRAMAKIFEIFSVCANDLIRVGHNLTLSLRLVCKTFNI